MPTALEKKLLNELAGGNTIRLDEFMHTALLDPEHGYYTNRKVFGKDGDFITAPDISQIFGEVIAAYLTANMLSTGKPATLVEFGPGRGTLMFDMLRSFKSMPPELNITEAILVEASEKLKDLQKENLKDSHVPIRWIDGADELPDSPCFIVANEFLDALPIRQFVKNDETWQERVVSIEDNTLTFDTTDTQLPDDCNTIIAECKHNPRDAKVLPLRAEDINQQADKPVFEYPEAAIAATKNIAQHIAKHGGMFIAIDYGHTMHGFGDTLQAVRKHKFVDALAHIGEADITAHVNFAWMKEIAEDAGLNTHLLTHQSKFLRSLGAELRAMSLCEGLDKNGQVDIASGLERLISPMQMGELFKVLVVAHPGMAVLELGI